MKKNKIMRFASCLLVATIMSTCAISGTYAKYTTSGTGTDTARVAKFGVTVTATGDTFAKEYDTDDSSVKATIRKSVVSNAPSGDNKDNVVAPGTKGEMAKMTLAGTPEVAVKVSYDVPETDGFKVSNWTYKQTNSGKTTITEEFYCPIKITIKKGNSDSTLTEVNGLDYSDATNFESAVKNAIKGYSKEYAANTDLSGKGDDTLTISWEWPFEGGTDTINSIVHNQDNVKDTYLGDQAAANDGTAATISLTVVTTVTQID